MNVRGLCLFVIGYVALCAACGAGAPRTRGALDAARLEKAEGLRAKERAPELWRELERAHAASDAAGEDEELRADEHAIARLWLEAAIAECERADLAAQRLVHEREIEGLYARALRDQRRAAQLTEETERKAAAAIARREASLALERAASVPARSPKLDKAAEAAATRALIARAVLVIESARALGAKPATLTEASTLIDRAQAALPVHGDQALDLADRALSQALVALGPVRATEREISAGEKQALVDDLQVLGARLTRGDQGLVAAIDGVQGVGARLNSSAARKLGRLCAVAIAHPHGPVRFVVSSPKPDASAGQNAAWSRSLAEAGCAGERFSVGARQGDGVLELHFLTY